MADKNAHSPKSYDGVMVSSTFADLQVHREVLMTALRKQEMFAIGMEDYVTIPDDDVISSSLNMVRKSRAYIGLISHRYGEPPQCDKRNPLGYSASRLEFEEAQTLGLPTLVFIMGEDHPGKRSDFETDGEKLEKLEEYRQRAKQGRIYVIFDSVGVFTEKAIHAVAKLAQYLKELVQPAPTNPEQNTAPTNITKSTTPLIPHPPAFYAESRYIGSHKFVGRKAQLDILDDWASPADPNPVLLFEAIGGTGKSMLTWEWVENHAVNTREDWAGRFWYSFYDKGAVMTDFCRRALAYITHQPLSEFQKINMNQLTKLLLPLLQAQPWLIILDGLERILVAYHRIDAAQLSDDDAGKTDEISDRDPCKAIRPEDDELLRFLAAANPSKILISSRLIPRVLLNNSSQPIPGVLRERLSGLRPADAEALIRSCGISGKSIAIRSYLQKHCDCHPLVIGALAGLVNDYLPDRGNFDQWEVDPGSGGNLNFGQLDLVQKRNHILKAALQALDDKSRQLLSTLALLSEAIDFETLSAFNPHLSPAPENIEVPKDPKETIFGSILTTDSQIKKYNEELHQYQQALNTWRNSKDCITATQELQATISNIEKRGLMQYDHQSKCYDLHPVIRGIMTGEMNQTDKECYGTLVVDHFSNQAHNPYEEAESLGDVSQVLQIVRTQIQMGSLDKATNGFLNDLYSTLSVNLNAHAESLAILRSFFPNGWDNKPNVNDINQQMGLTFYAAQTLGAVGEVEYALKATNAGVFMALKELNIDLILLFLFNVSDIFYGKSQLAKQIQCILIGLELATVTDDASHLFSFRLYQFRQLTGVGQWEGAESIWPFFHQRSESQSRRHYRSGFAEFYYAELNFYQGKLTHDDLTKSELLAKKGKDRNCIRGLHLLRGHWHLIRKQYQLAINSLLESTRMAHEVGLSASDSEAKLALARYHIGLLPDPQQEAQRLAEASDADHLSLAELWLAIGDIKQAKKHALSAYKWAWADGEPHVWRWELDQAKALLNKLEVPAPDLPVYDPTKAERFPWQDELEALIEKLRAEKETSSKQ
ncbi:MAG: DUF4062 domain-containing protein [Algicola sp.]|nr:DUF4062 domain-containing protein [Algicola sp.]